MKQLNIKIKIIVILYTLLSLCSALNYTEYFNNDCSGTIYSTTEFNKCQNQNFLQMSTLFQCNQNNTFSIITYDSQNCSSSFFKPTIITYPSDKCIYMSGPPTTNQTIYGIGYCNSILTKPTNSVQTIINAAPTTIHINASSCIKNKLNTLFIILTILLLNLN